MLIANKAKFYHETIFPYGKLVDKFVYSDSLSHMWCRRENWECMGKQFVVLFKDGRLMDILVKE